MPERRQCILIESHGGRFGSVFQGTEWYDSHFWGIQYRGGHCALAVFDTRPTEAARIWLTSLACFSKVDTREIAEIEVTPSVRAILDRLHAEEPSGFWAELWYSLCGSITPFEPTTAEQSLIIDTIRGAQLLLSTASVRA